MTPRESAGVFGTGDDGAARPTIEPTVALPADPVVDHTGADQPAGTAPVPNAAAIRSGEAPDASSAARRMRA